MLKKILTLTALVLTLSPMAQAADQVVITCRDHNVSLTDRGDVVVSGPSKDSRTMILAGTEDVVQNDNDGLNLQAAKKRMGMVFAKQSLEVNYKTGKGAVSDYQMIAGSMSGKKFDLESCSRVQ